MADTAIHHTGLAMGWFEEELLQVHITLRSAADELRSPLSNLVRMQVEAAHPLVRGSIVLAVAYRSPDSPADRARRVWLASALEMLHVALSVHKLLLADGLAEADLDKSLIGSTILAGDYCFSRAAQLAAQTDSPRVVEIIAEALKNISEMQLRTLFESQQRASDPPEVLIRSGVLSGAELSRLTPSETDTVLAASAGLINRSADPLTPAEIETLLTAVPQFQRTAWEGLVSWLSGVRAATGNGTHSGQRSPSSS